MSNLLSANMARLKGNKAFWCGLLLLTVWGAVERIGVYADADSGQLDEAFWIGALLIGFVLSVFVSLFVGTEYSDGAMLNPNRSVSAIICVSLAFLLLFSGTAIYDQLEEEEAYFIPDESLAQGEIADPAASEWVLNPNYLSGDERRTYELMFEILPGGQSLRLSGMLDEGRHYAEMLSASLAWTVLSCGRGSILFQKRDLK